MNMHEHVAWLGAGRAVVTCRSLWGWAAVRTTAPAAGAGREGAPSCSVTCAVVSAFRSAARPPSRRPDGLAGSAACVSHATKPSSRRETRSCLPTAFPGPPPRNSVAVRAQRLVGCSCMQSHTGTRGVSGCAASASRILRGQGGAVGVGGRHPSRHLCMRCSGWIACLPPAPQVVGLAQG